MAGQRALVTGARGFIGARLCRLLRAYGTHVTGVSRREEPIVDADQTLKLDLADAEATARAVTDIHPTLVFHLAAVTSAARERDMVRSTFNANVVSTVNLLEATSGLALKRFVLAGSLEEPAVTAYGDVSASSPYALSKHAAGCYARLYHDLYGLPAVTTRIFMVYGPGQTDTRKLVPYVTTSLLQNQTPRLTSGRRPVDWVFVDDVARDLALTATVDSTVGHTIDIGTGVLTPVATIAGRIAQLIESKAQPVFGEVPDRADEQVRAADLAARRLLLGDLRATTIDEGLEQTVAWYRQQIRSHSSEPR